MASAHCLRLFVHWLALPRARALESAGMRIEAKIAMMAITTRSSIRVKSMDFLFELKQKCLVLSIFLTFPVSCCVYFFSHFAAFAPMSERLKQPSK